MIPAIVLAAGQSTRMGRTKANLPAGRLAEGDSFLAHIVRTLTGAGIEDVVVVLGHDRDAVLERFSASGLAARFVVNPDYARGQLSSLLTGLRVVDRPGVAAAMVTLVDVPFASAATVRAVIDRYRVVHSPIVRPTSGGRHGHPMLIDRSVFDELRRADARTGAKPVVRAHATAAGDFEIADEGAFLDVDTPEDYDRALGLFAR